MSQYGAQIYRAEFDDLVKKLKRPVDFEVVELMGRVLQDLGSAEEVLSNPLVCAVVDQARRVSTLEELVSELRELAEDETV